VPSIPHVTFCQVFSAAVSWGTLHNKKEFNKNIYILTLFLEKRENKRVIENFGVLLHQINK
jgi:hypothetical protein